MYANNPHKALGSSPLFPGSSLYTPDPSDRLSNLGENGLIQNIRNWLGSVNPPAPTGMGDDCAVLRSLPAGYQLLTVDSLTFGQHFDEKVSPNDAGAKLMKRNLSDLAAMGGTPGPAVLALLCAPDVSVSWLKAFFSGIRQVCEEYGVQIVGGDVSALPEGNFSSVLTLTGSVERPALRTSANIGDSIYVTGTLGGSILQKHFAFEPRMQEGRWLAQHPDCTAMMDLTDGLSKDVLALLPEDCAAWMHLDGIPIAADAHTCAAKSGKPVLEHAFCDGEDYELLFTLHHRADPQAFEAEWTQRFPDLKLSRIGTFQLDPEGKRLMDARTKEGLPWQRGFEHFHKQ